MDDVQSKILGKCVVGCWPDLLGANSQNSWLTNRYFEVPVLFRWKLLQIHNLGELGVYTMHKSITQEWSAELGLGVPPGESNKVEFLKRAVFVTKPFDPICFE